MHPLFDLARKIDRNRKARLARRRLTEVLRDPHLARDVGLPHRPRQPLRTELW